MNHLSLFSGIGGIDLAAEIAGIKTVGQIEHDKFCIKVLEKNFGDLPRWSDIKNVEPDEIIKKCGTIDIISGGDPCQPHSGAGKRLGKEDKRYLWPEMLRIIKGVKPNWIINENVAGSVSNGILLEKLNSLENENYKCQSFSIPAFAVGAWHFRQRIFIVANSNSIRPQRWAKSRNIKEKQEKQFERFYKIHTFDTDCKPELQNNKQISTIRKKWEAWKNITGKFGRKISRNYWEISKPPVPGVDDGISDRMDRSKSLGNAVVPQQILPIFECIVKIESEDSYEKL